MQVGACFSLCAEHSCVFGKMFVLVCVSFMAQPFHRFVATFSFWSLGADPRSGNDNQETHFLVSRGTDRAGRAPPDLPGDEARKKRAGRASPKERPEKNGSGRASIFERPEKNGRVGPLFLRGPKKTGRVGRAPCFYTNFLKHLQQA
jgi:hypothetical protein